jgi:ADP-dependent NAD(P)H-hydrate dehydratase / NAD(P)H-hydrate epimerase
MLELLTTEEMAEADRRAVSMGVPSLTLMETAGRAVADEAAKMVAPGSRIAVLCGPGNNGGDGFVAARLLRERGCDVRVACLAPIDQLKGDAAVMAGRWGGLISTDASSALADAHLAIDALFGAGLQRPLEPSANAYVAAMNGSGIAILAVDVPSGLDGTTGMVIGDDVVEADRTVTFFRKKPGHLLMPGRALCGEVILADIGIPDAVLESPPPTRGEGLEVGGVPKAGNLDSPPPGLPHKGGGVANPSPRRAEGSASARGGGGFHVATFENTPALWLRHFPRPLLSSHKYTRGHALVVSGPSHATGAARLAARGALRVGAGLVTVASTPQALLVNAAHLTAMMLVPFTDARDLAEILEDKRRNAVLIGPGAGVDENTRDLTLAVLASDASVVLDADALSSFVREDQSPAATVHFGFTSSRTKSSSSPAALFAAIRTKPDRAVVMTPHEGEFKRLFPELESLASKLDRARAAAKLSGAIVVLKGPDTVIAAPDGFAAINANAPPTLATAGSGDVLAGFITGLIAQGMPAFHASCASVWLHGECANVFGPGLIAEDLPETLPKVLASRTAD